jgi:hypothetical protein
MPEDIYKTPEISHKEFVQKYRGRGIEVLVNRSLALRTISARYVPNRYYYAHTFWSWVWFLLIPTGIILIFTKGLLPGMGVLILSALVGSATKKSACQFMIDYALENEVFYKFCVEGKVLIIKKVH